jgi:N6-adenosine-specific RNA methylase IME4
MIEPSLDKFELNPRLEMFARYLRPGWNSIGEEITGNDIRIDLEKLYDDVS